MKHYKDKNKGKRFDTFIENHNRKLLNSLRFEKERKIDDDLYVGKELPVKIMTIGSKGDGIAKYKSYTIIVPDTKVDDDIKVVIKKITQSNLIFAEKISNS